MDTPHTTSFSRSPKLGLSGVGQDGKHSPHTAHTLSPGLGPFQVGAVGGGEHDISGTGGSELTGTSTIQPVSTLWGQLPACSRCPFLLSQRGPTWPASDPRDLHPSSASLMCVPTSGSLLASLCLGWSSALSQSGDRARSSAAKMRPASHRGPWRCRTPSS